MFCANFAYAQPMITDVWSNSANKDNLNNNEIKIPQIYIDNISIQQKSFKAGDVVSGSFMIFNPGDESASGIYYHISLIGGYDGNKIENSLYEETQEGPYFLNAKEKRTINFDYVLPKSIPTSSLGIKIRAYLKSGIPLGWSDAAINVQGGISVVEIKSAVISIGGKEFYPSTAPTINNGETAVLKMVLFNPSEDQIYLVPEINVYNMSSTQDLLSTSREKMIHVDSGKETEVSIVLPVFEYTSRVYAGEVNFFDENGVKRIQAVPFRYIIGGDVVTIQTANADKSSVSKGETINVGVLTNGPTLDINDGNVKKIGNADIKVELFNEKGQSIGLAQENLNFDSSQSIKLPIVASRDASQISIKVIISKGDKVLAYYNTNFYQEVSKNKFNISNILIPIIILVLVISILILMRNKKFLKMLRLAVLFLVISSGFLISANSVYGFTIYDQTSSHPSFTSLNPYDGQTFMTNNDIPIYGSAIVSQSLSVPLVSNITVQVYGPSPSSDMVYSWSQDYNYSKGQDVTSGLVAQWKFDDGSGITAVDSSGNNKTLSLGNGPTWISGKIGGAISSDGVNDYGISPQIDLSGTKAVSISEWFKTSLSGERNQVEFSSDFNNKTTGFALIFNSPACGANTLGVGLKGNVNYNAACYTKPSAGVWHHAVAIFDKSKSTNEVDLYIDGVLQTPISRPFNANNNNNFAQDILYLFSRAGSQLFYPGSTDEFSLYNRAITSQEVSYLYNLGGSTSQTEDFSTTFKPTQPGTYRAYARVTYHQCWGTSCIDEYQIVYQDFNVVSGNSCADPAGGTALNDGESKTYYKDSSLQCGETSGPIAWWKFDDGSGNTAIDSSGNNQTMSLANGPMWTMGEIGGALSFDGVNDEGFVKLYNLNNTQVVSIAAWIKHDFSATSYQKFFDNDYVKIKPSFFSVLNDSQCGTNSVSPVIEGDGPVYNNACYTGPSSNVWHHYVFIFDKSKSTNEVDLYIDGVFQTPISRPLNADTIGYFHDGYDFYLARMVEAPGDFSSAVMDDFRIYNRLLTAQEVSQIYGSTNDIANNLVAWWKFDDVSGNIAVDSSYNNKDMTLKNEPTWTLGQIVGGLSFDGINDYGLSPKIDLRDTNAISVTGWFKKDYADFNRDVKFFQFDSSGVDTERAYMYSVYDTGAGVCADKIAVGLRGNTGFNYSCYNQPSSNVWHHFVAIYDKSKSSNETDLYIDGVLQTPLGRPLNNDNSDNFSNSDFALSYESSVPPSYNKGLADDVRIYNKALTSQEVSQIFTGSGGSCQSEVRTCINGTLSGTFTKTSCTVGSCDCIGPDGALILNGGSKTYYLNNNPPENCKSESRVCTDGTLSGNYAYPTCTPGHSVCTDPAGGADLKDGETRTYYSVKFQTTQALCNSKSVNRTCNNGTVSGNKDYKYASCVASPMYQEF